MDDDGEDHCKPRETCVLSLGNHYPGRLPTVHQCVSVLSYCCNCGCEHFDGGGRRPQVVLQVRVQLSCCSGRVAALMSEAAPIPPTSSNGARDEQPGGAGPAATAALASKHFNFKYESGVWRNTPGWEPLRAVGVISCHREACRFSCRHCHHTCETVRVRCSTCTKHTDRAFPSPPHNFY